MAVNLIPFVFPGVAGVRCAFQTRKGGVSQGSFAGGNIAFSVPDNPACVLENRKDLVRTLGLDVSATTGLAEVNQVHGDTLLCDPSPLSAFDGPLPAKLPDADGLATSQPGLGLMIKTADCQPVLVAHRLGRHVAAFHVGWRGNRLGFLQSGLATFCKRYELAPADLFAVRGPSLGPARAEFVNFDREWGPDFARWFSPVTRTMNLWQLTRDQLVQAGLRPEHLFGLDLCTASLGDSFFSYRADRNSGRQASVIWIEQS